MRVVAGSARGRRLVTPAGRGVRPTTDRVREAVFNALQSLDAIRGAVVLDLFAGSGALGVEAASRGAASVTFVDASRSAIEAVRANLASTATLAATNVHRADAIDWLAHSTNDFDLVLLDPPYEFDRWPEVLGAIAPRVTGAGYVVIESNREISMPARLRTVRDRVYGSTFVRIASVGADPRLSPGDGGALP